MRPYLLTLALLTCWTLSIAAQSGSLTVATLTEYALSVRVDGSAISLIDTQGLEARVHVDTNPIAFVLAGVTCVPAVPVSLLDASGAVWTLGPGPGPEWATLRNGVPVGGGFGISLALVNGLIFTEGTDLIWWTWTGSTWRQIGAGDPSAATLVAAVQHAWTCQAPLTPALVTALNAPGSHALVVRVYDPVVKAESPDSAPYTVTRPQGITAPTLALVSPINH